MTPAERAIIERRDRDRGFFRWSRIWDAFRRDRTRQLEIAVGVLGLALPGGLIAFRLTTFPPPDVQFLLQAWWLNEQRLGLVLLAIGVLQVLGTATQAHKGRAVIALLGFGVCSAVTSAYLLAYLQAYFHAWVMYLGVSVCECYLAARNFSAHARLAKARTALRDIVARRART